MYNQLVRANTDISEHLPTLRLLLSQCSSAIEFGVRTGVSTQAFLTTNIPTIHIDIDPQPFIFPHPHQFVQASTLNITIPETDLLFIDTDHTYEQLSKELALHGNKANKFLVFHDTTTFETALMPAINEFLQSNPHWQLAARYYNNNGLTVLIRNNNTLSPI